jgi:hypothetical protein
VTTVELKVVGHTGTSGTVHATLGAADIVRIAPLGSVLNKAASMRFGLHNLNPKLAEVKAIEREVQVWRNGSLVAGDGWLVPITPEATIDGETDVTEFECRGLQWHLDRRHIGDADRRDYLDGKGDFETVADFAAWTVSGTTATRDNAHPANGDWAAKLVQASAGTDTYITRSVTITAPAVGAWMTVAAWFFAEVAGWVGEAAGRRGLMIARKVAGTIVEFDFAELNNGEPGEVPLGEPQRRKVGIQIPPNATEDIEIRLYSPGGTIWWDAVVLVAMDSLSFPDTDQATIGDAIVAHLQDAAYGKSDLLIGRDAPATGKKRTIHYQHAEHAPGGRALADFAELDDGYDSSIVIDPDSRTWTVHYPRKGTARPPLAWSELVRARLVSVEGDEAASSVVVQGDGDGPDREEGAAIDAAAFGGVTLEMVMSAEPGTTIDRLDSKAAEELRVRSSARRFDFTLGPGLRFGAMATGDTFAGPPAHGEVDPSGDWRAVSVDWDPVTDCLSVSAEAA